MEDLFQTIIAQTYTMADLRRRLRLLKTHFSTKFFSQAPNIPQDLEKGDEEWLNSIIPNVALTKEDFTKTFTSLEEKAHAVNPLVIFIPLNLPGNEMDKLGRKIREDFGRDLLIEVRIDPFLIGGAALAWKGVYRDYSLKQKIKDHKDAIMAIFQKYIVA